MDIFAGSLPFKLTEDDLKKLFEQYGQVNSVKIIIDKITRQNKGFGFIEMPNDAEAEKAIEALNGFEVMGRQIVVNKSEKKENRGDSNRTFEKRNDYKKPNNYGSNNYDSNNSSEEKSSSGNNRNFGPNKVKGGGYSNNKSYNKGGNNKNKGFNRGGKRDNYDDNSY